jgi:hypothetical protein
MIGRLALVLCGGVSLTATAAAAEPRVRFYKAIDRGDAKGEEILAVPLDSDVYAATRDGYPDVRIVDDRGSDVPYLVQQVGRTRSAQVREPCTSKVVSLRVHGGKGLEIDLALDEKSPLAGGATIRSPLTDYEHRVAVYGSRTGSDRSLLVSDGVIFDYSRFMDVRNRDVLFPANDYRRFRFKIEHELDDRASPLRELIRSRRMGHQENRVEITQTERRPFRIDGVDLWRTVEKQTGTQTAVANHPIAGFQIAHDAKAQVSRVTIDSRREPLARFTLTTTSRNFSRPARVLVPVVTGAHTEWVEVGRGTLLLIQFRAFRQAELHVEFPQQRPEHYQLVIDNADNPPLDISGVEGEGPDYRLVFLSSEGRTCRLEYGSENLGQPRYDTAAVLGALERGYQPVPVKLGTQFAMSGYRSEQSLRAIIISGAFLGLVIIAMVLVLTWALYRAGQRLEKLRQEEL